MAKDTFRNTLRIPPQHLDAERALLGSVLIRSDILNEIGDIVQTRYFYSEKHRMIFETMLELFMKREPIDIISLSSRLKEKNILEQIGGSSYLAELVNLVPTASNASHYGEIVRKKSILRDLIQAADHVGELGYSEEDEIEETLDKAEKKIHEVTTSMNSREYVQLKDTLEEAWERMDKLHKEGELRGVPTGFKDLDNKLAGLQKSDLVILAARPSVGKTSFALDIARHAATKDNIPVLIFSLEMSNQQLVDRMLAAEAQIDSWKMRRGKLSLDEDFGRFQHALDTLSKAPVFIDDQPMNSIMKMRSTARRISREHGLGLIIVDYLQLMSTSKTYDSMVNQVTEISHSLKALAREMNVPVLALSQLSRAVEQRGGRPRLSDLRDSGSIEQDADVVMFLHREDRNKEGSERPNIVEVLIEKHRNGPTGKADLYFDEKRISFISIEGAGGFDEFTQSAAQAF